MTNISYPCPYLTTMHFRLYESAIIFCPNNVTTNLFPVLNLPQPLTPVCFWSFIRKTRNTPSILSNIVLDGFTSSNTAKFSKYFSSVYSSINSSLPSSSIPNHTLPNRVLLSIDDNSRAFYTLRSDYSIDPESGQYSRGLSIPLKRCHRLASLYSVQQIFGVWCSSLST